MQKNNTIGAFEAKTHLSQLLEKVQSGNEIIITKRGKPIAKLVPVKKTSRERELVEILKEFDLIRAKCKGAVNVKQAVAEGRKY